MNTLFHTAKLVFSTIFLILALLVFWIYMIPGAMLGLFIGRKCPEWIVYALGVALAIACRMVTGAWFLRFGDVPISGLSMTGVIVGFSLLEHDESDPRFLGYDIIDGYYDISLLTNWGDDFSAANSAIASNGLIATRESVDHVFAELHRLSPEDPHVEGCQIISVYSTAHITN